MSASRTYNSLHSEQVNENTMADSRNREQETEIAHLRQLSAILDRMRLNGGMTDITLVCENKEFHAHRFILAAVSPYFQSTWGSEWKEQHAGRYELPSTSPETIDAMMSFVYTGKLKNASMARNKDAMLNLLEASDYFQIENLTEYCFEILSDLLLRTNNFLEMYILADKYNNQSLISGIEDLLSTNFSDVSQTNDFLQLKEDQLHKLLRHPKVNQSSMDKIFKALLQWTEFGGEKRRDTLQGLIQTLDQSWCSVWLSDLVVKNISNDCWNRSTISSLLEIVASRGRVVMHHQMANDNVNIVCFGDGHVMSMYDVEKDEWLPVKQVPFCLNRRVAVIAYHQHIYLIGGESEEHFSPSSAVIEYCPFTDTVVNPKSEGLLFPVYNAGVGVFNNFIYVVNGMEKEYEEFLSVQRYDPRLGTCCQLASTVKWHKKPFLFSFSHNLHIFGATCDDKSLERYDPFTNQWTELTYMIGIHDYVVTFCYHKLFCLSETNIGTGSLVFNLSSGQQETIEFHEGPENVLALWSCRQREKIFLLALDSCYSLYFYDVVTMQWAKRGEWNTAAEFRLCHRLSCLI